MKSWNVFKRYTKQQLNVGKEEHERETYQEIKDGAYFSGYNLWVLGFAMIIACIGLNTDSISALIGAMLISPLMGPILGFSFGLAVNDNLLKKQSIRNWILMTLISLLASTFFFLLSPFDNNTNALISFTKASIFDILLAFFGGMAGFIGIIKKEGNKVLAGVAVATACMPPLCTAGYGIAQLNLSYILGGLYFYFINCLFIGLATFILTRFFKFHTFFNNNTDIQKTTKWIWIAIIIIMLLPGIYIAYKKYKEEYITPKSVVSDKERIDILEQKVGQLDSLLKVQK